MVIFDRLFIVPLNLVDKGHTGADVVVIDVTMINFEVDFHGFGIISMQTEIC
jgi:hypothetical protein